MRGKILHSFYNGFLKPTAELTAITVSATAIGVGTAEAFKAGKNYVTEQFNTNNTPESNDATPSPSNRF